MDLKNRSFGFLGRLLAVVALLVALPAPSAVANEECEASMLAGDPLVLRGQRIPLYEVFETFLLHASVIRDTQGWEAYRTFAEEYGLDPELQTVQELPLAFDDLQASLRPNESGAEHRKAARLGEILSRLGADIATNPSARDAEQTFRLRLMQHFRPTMSWLFVGETPDFFAIDEAEEDFYSALDVEPGDSAFDSGMGELAGIQAGIATSKHGTDPSAVQPSSGRRIKISYLGGLGVVTAHPDPSTHDKAQISALAEFQWRRYAGEDGSVRIIGVVDMGLGPRGVVDMGFRSVEDVRTDFQQGGGEGPLHFTEYFQVDPAHWEKSHTTASCLAASAAAGVTCAACAAAPGPLNPACAACAVAVATVVARCNLPHCNDIECNAICVNACALYGYCTSTSGSSSPADCRCEGQRFDTAGCRLPAPGCDGVTTEVSMLALDGGAAIRVATDPIALRRLEESDLLHHGVEMTYLMGEWAVVAFETAGAANKAGPTVRTLRTSSPEIATAAERLQVGLPGAKAGSGASGIAIVVATPPHEANSREIPLPTLEVAIGNLPAGSGRGTLAIRADFSEAGELQDFEILHDTLGGVTPALAAHVAKALSLRRASDKNHRVIAFAVLSVGDSLRIESSVPYLPKCCCGDFFCD